MIDGTANCRQLIVIIGQREQINWRQRWA